MMMIDPNKKLLLFETTPHATHHFRYNFPIEMIIHVLFNLDYVITGIISLLTYGEFSLTFTLAFSPWSEHSNARGAGARHVATGLCSDTRTSPTSSRIFFSSTTPPKSQHSSSEELVPTATISHENFIQKVSSEKLTSKNIVDTILYPDSTYSDRMEIGRDAQFGAINSESSNVHEISSESNNGALDANDPRLSLTYHEFPLNSVEILLNRACEEYENDDRNIGKPSVFIDLGSGCGKVVLHEAMSKFNDLSYEPSNSWQQVHGIEISSLMHDYALGIIDIAIHEGFLNKHTKANHDKTANRRTDIYFHEGAAEDHKHILSQADVIFCYSTVFDSDGFNVDIGAMVLSDGWSMLLADSCKPGTVVVTTDRALNPNLGWKLMQCIEVDNASLFGSTGFISIKE